MSSWNKRKKYSIEQKEITTEEQRKSQWRFSSTLKRQMYLSVMSVVGVTLIMMGTTYSIFSSVNESKDYNTISVGTLQITYDDTSTGLGNIINLSDAFPIEDAAALATTPYKFKMTNTGSLASDYSLRFVDDTAMIEADACQDVLLSKQYIKYSINGAAGVMLNSVEGNGYIVASGTLQPGETITYEIRMWIPEQIAGTYVGNDVLGRHFHGKVVVEGLKSDTQPTM